MAVKDRGYPWVVKWGKYLGSQDYYIQDQCDKAAEEKAPKDAIYSNDDGTWATIQGIANQRTRSALGLDPLKPVDPAALGSYGAEIVHQERATGEDNFLYQVQFPDMYHAAAWAHEYKVSGRVNLVPVYLTDGGFHPFDQKVVVALQPE